MKDSADILIDYVTGRRLPNRGAEENRQRFERFLVLERGFERSDIGVDCSIVVPLAEDVYRSCLDLVISIDAVHFMAVKCAAGSLDSRQREILSGARLFAAHQIPLSVATDGRTAILWETISGRKIGEGLDAVPSRSDALRLLSTRTPTALPADRRQKEALIFRSYDGMNVHASGKR